MNKNAILFAVVLVGCVAVAQAKFSEEVGTKASMSDAYQNGKNFFSSLSGRRKQETEDAAATQTAPTKPFSHYTAKLVALGGGKPRPADQYRDHHYLPPTPVVVPREHPSLHAGLTPSIAAEIYRPQPPLQYTTDRVGARL